MVNSALIVGGLGLFGVVVGALGLSGRLMRLPSVTMAGNYSAQLLCGLALIGMSAVSVLRARDDLATLTTLVGLPTLAVLGIGIYAFTIRPPRWAQPQWQRELDEAHRRSR